MTKTYRRASRRDLTDQQALHLAQLQVAHQAIDAAAYTARTRRNDLLVQAVDDGIPVAKIAVTLGITRARVYQILDALDGDKGQTTVEATQ